MAAPEILTASGKSSAEFRKKPPEQQRVINDALHILQKLGIPIANTPRRLEKMALVFLAVADVKAVGDWRNAKDLDAGRSLKTRDIINYINANFSEEISLGSYDDIRRKDLALLMAAGIVLPTKPGANPNDSSRGYALNPDFAAVVRTYGNPDWEESTESFMQQGTKLAELLAARRAIDRTNVTIPSGKVLSFSPGPHSDLLKAIIEEFLPRYGYNSELLYVGDVADRLQLKEEARLKELQFFDLSAGLLPDVVAYSKDKNWIYLIEAVHTSGEIDKLRRQKLKLLTAQCTAGIVYVTAFPDRKTFRARLPNIAWETEVWIADEPDHIAHFDGERFLGPYDTP